MPASAQGVVSQSGAMVPGHLPVWSVNRVVRDAGSAGGNGPGLGELLQVNPATPAGTGPNGEHSCFLSAPANTAHYALCIDAKALNGGLISFNAYNGAPQLDLLFNVNGSTVHFPGPGAGTIVGPVSTSVGMPVVFNNTTGTLAKQGAINEPLTSSFWDGPTGVQTRLANRVFLGAAVLDTGVNTFPQADWLSQLTQAGQSQVPFGTGDFATVYILSNPTPVAGSPATIATPTQALMVGNESLSGVSTSTTTYSTPRTIECAMVNNVIAAPSGGGPPVPAWCHYSAAHRVSANAGSTYVAEFEVANFQAAVTGWTPEVANGAGTIGLELGSGAGLSSSGQAATTVAMYLAANPTQFGAGILMFNNSIGLYGPSASPLPSGAGPGATITALGLMYNQEIQWYHTGLQGRIFGDTANHMHIHSGSGQVDIDGQINSTGNNAVLNAPTTFKAILSVNNVVGAAWNGSNLSPGTTNAFDLGTAAARWQNAYIKNVIETTATPLGADACIVGQVTFDTNFAYFCPSSGNWRRVAITGY